MGENRFKDRHVAVTGAGRGIGRAIALSFATEGARVSLISRTPGELEQSIQAAGEESRRRMAAFPCDVSNLDAVSETLDAARRASGPVDVVVNNAGVFLYKPFLDYSAADWHRVIGTNLTGAFNFCRAAAPEMVKRRRGRLVNVSSIHGFHADANLAAHVAAKFGLIGFTKALALELREHNVSVNAVCPGTTDNREEGLAVEPRKNPLTEKLRPQDVASAVLWLASEESAGITGAAIEIYGRSFVKIQG
jgi:3-oxoacyl-[acyl-carrier protein] reductase